MQHEFLRYKHWDLPLREKEMDCQLLWSGKSNFRAMARKLFLTGYKQWSMENRDVKGKTTIGRFL